jgi:hypothetical protein
MRTVTKPITQTQANRLISSAFLGYESLLALDGAVIKLNPETDQGNNLFKYVFISFECRRFYSRECTCVI